MRQPTHIKSLRQTAISWFMKIQHADEEHPDRTRFEAWLMASPAHQQAYAEVSDVWDDFDSTSQLKSLASAMEQKQFLEQQQRPHKLNKTMAKAFSILLLTMGSLFGYQLWQSQPTLELVAEAGVGQIKTQHLEDGTKLTLDANSEVEVAYYKDKRMVKLKRGEAIFEVARDASRPFVVDSGAARVTVLGTRFAVNRLQNLVRISVDHGKVNVDSQDARGNITSAPLLLRDGEVAEIRLMSEPKRVARSAKDAFGFQEGAITFDQADLHEIAETLSRYRKPVVIARQLQQNSTRITAVIKTNDVEQFLANLPEIASVQVKSTPAQTILVAK